MQIEKATFALIDTETTGSKPESARPCQVSVLIIKNGQRVDKKTWLINPEVRIPPDAAGFHQITNEMVKDAPTLAQVQDEIKKFVGDATPVSYKAPFHKAMLPFIQQEWICCHRLARHSFEFGEVNKKGFPLESHDDQYLRYWLGAKVETGETPCHNAEADVESFRVVFNEAVERFLDRGFDNDVDRLIGFANNPVILSKISCGGYRDASVEELDTHWLRGQVFGIRNGEISLDPDIAHTIMTEYDKRTKRVLARP